VDACFDDLSDRIFALETGLSSDPSMNRRVSQLDRYALVSNSDAHSPIKLGRECNRFCGEPGFGFIRQAIESNDPDTFKGTVEFYPEEGKYHYDGHRKCHLCFDPDQTRSHSGICPKCGKPLTLGVLYRVEELADRKENDATEGDPPFHSLIPLQDILSELLSVGPGTKTVLKTYHSLLDRLGCEYDILLTMAPDALDRTGVPLLGEAIRRMRVGDIVISPGYDGEFGKVRIFEEGEKKRLLGQTGLFPKSEAKPKKPAASARDIAVPFFEPARPASQDSRETVPTQDPCLNKSQQQAVESRRQHTLIIAGPGTGKTRTLTHRIAYIIESREVNAETILAVTFTTKAAAEMRERLMSLLGTHSTMPTIGTFHALGHQILSEVQPTPVHVIDDSDRLELVSEAVADVGITGIRKTDLLHRIVTAKQRLRSVHDDLQDIAGPVESNAFTRVYARYQELLEILGVFDFEDLIAHSIAVLETEGAFRDRFRNRFCHLFIDEYQDLNFSQYRMIKALYGQGAPHRSICAIGDPNQSI